MFKKITQSPILNLVSGVVLLVTAGYEVMLGLGESPMGAAHGIFVFSIVQIFKSIPEILHGLEKLEKVAAHKVHKP